MRIIKVRAWDNGRMYPVNTLSLVSENHQYSGSFSHDYIGKKSGDCYQFSDEAIFMEYTGLKDRFGSEIYENDIINIAYETVNEVGEDTMEYEENVLVEWDFEFLCRLKYDLKGLEKIGDKYHNPELLKEKE